MMRYAGFLMVGLAFVVAPAFAQERAAGGAMDTQMTWTALSNKVNSTQTYAQGVNSRVDQVVACNRKSMAYAPGTAGADAQGCIDITKLIDLSNRVSVLENRTTATETNTSNILTCGTSGVVYNPTTKACEAKTSAIQVDYAHCSFAQGGSGGGAGRALGISFGTANAGALYCPKDYVMVGTNDLSVGSALCCKLK